MILRKKGFTLIEMLVVIAIIAILAAALFPAITSAINAAKGTAQLARGTAIYKAVISANSDREPLDLKAIWPGDAAASNLNTSTAYFVGLMATPISSGTILGTSIAADVESRMCGDLTPAHFAGMDWKADTAGGFAAANNTWHVLKVRDTDWPQVPFLISRNVGLSGTINSSSFSNVTISGASSMSSSLGLVIARGGQSYSMRKTYFPSKCAEMMLTNSLAVSNP